MELQTLLRGGPCPEEPSEPLLGQGRDIPGWQPEVHLPARVPHDLRKPSSYRKRVPHGRGRGEERAGDALQSHRRLDQRARRRHLAPDGLLRRPLLQQEPQGLIC